MRVGFNARTLAAPQIRGWTRYAVELLRHLPEFGIEPVLFTDQPLNPEYLACLPVGSFRVAQSPSMRYLAWEQSWLPFACARERVQLLHAPANYGLPLLGACPSVLTLHDAIDEAFPRPQTAWSARERLVRASFWAARRVAKRVITVSAHAKTDLVKYFSLPANKIVVIHEAGSLHELSQSQTDEQHAFDALGIHGSFVLYAGGFERRKNVEFLVEAFRAASLGGVSLVLVGGSPPAWLEAAAARSDGSIHLTGFVSDAALAAFYRRALVFVYPSLYEGFGLQLCEAMSFACPTLAADSTSLPEILGQGGDTFCPTQPAALIALLKKVTHEPSYRNELVARARARAADFSWQRTAACTNDVYRSCK